MAKIRKISYRDIYQVKRLISVISTDNIMSYRRLFFLSVPLTYIQNFLYNVHFRKYPETYVISDKNRELKGVITVKAQRGNPFKWQIKRLFLDKSSHNEGKQLVDYIMAKFGARGVDTFYVCFDDSQAELIDLFVKGCSFRMCSSESLWQNNTPEIIVDDVNENIFRPFKNIDAYKTAELFNETIIPLYKYSLQKKKEEFFDNFFQGFDSELHFKYVVDNDINTLKGYLEIKTFDNKNYFLDVIVSTAFLELYPQIISFAIKKIKKRNKNFNLFIKNRKYLLTADFFETILKQNKFEFVNNNVVLVKDFFKIIKEDSKSFSQAAIFSSFEI